MDLRVKRTRKMLREALWDIIQEKGIESLSVRELCERAMINRATFYRHYEDINDLLLRGLDEFFDEIQGDPFMSEEEIVNNEIREPSSKHYQFITFLDERKDFFKLMLSDKGLPSFQNRLLQYIEEAILCGIKQEFSCQTVQPQPLVPAELLASSLAGRFMGILRWWFSIDCRVPYEEMGYYMIALFYYNDYEVSDTPRPRLQFDLKKKLEVANRRFEDSGNQAH